MNGSPVRYSKLQTGLTGRVGQSGHSTVILTTSAVKPDRFHSGFDRSLGDRRAEFRSGVTIPTVADLVPQTLVPGTGRSQCLPGSIIDELATEISMTARDTEARLIRRTADPLPNSVLPPLFLFSNEFLFIHSIRPIVSCSHLEKSAPRRLLTWLPYPV